MAFGFSQPIQCRVDELVAGTRAQLIVKLFGTDLDSLVSLSRAVASAIGGLRGATDLVVEKTAGQPTLVVEVDRERLSRHGLNAADVLEIVETAVGGRAAAKFYERDRAVDAVVRYPEAERRSGREIGSLLIPCPGGYALPLGQLAEIRTEEGPVQVSREDGQRRIGIEINVSGRDLGGFVAEAKRTVAGKVRLPEGVRLAWGGQFENQERAMRRFAFLVPAVIAMIFALLSATFSAWRPALLVLLNLPFALIGGVFALALSGLYLSVPASVGFIVLFGVAVLNGMVLMSRVLQLSEQGMSVPAAVRRACDDRLRPVLMTATISVFSLLPMLAASGPGSEIQRPLATVVVGGLLTSTLLTLVLLPVMTAWVMEDRRKA
jgi:cobalt-zinc-cadmium resistance protein CzcA